MRARNFGTHFLVKYEFLSIAPYLKCCFEATKCIVFPDVLPACIVFFDVLPECFAALSQGGIGVHLTTYGLRLLHLHISFLQEGSAATRLVPSSGK